MADEGEAGSAWARRRSAEANRIELVALRLCLEHGPDSVTIEQIATAAGISRRTFYRYFSTIDDILTASPGRVLRRIARSVRARPQTENIRNAFVNAAPQFAASGEELPLQTLHARVANRYPAQWSRAMGRVRPAYSELYEQMVADRLEASGENLHFAPLIANVLSAVIAEVADKSHIDGEFTFDPVAVDAALTAVTRAVTL